MKKFITLLLSMVVCFGMVALPSQASEPDVHPYHASFQANYSQGVMQSYYAKGYIAVPFSFGTPNVTVHYTYDGVNWQDVNASLYKDSDGHHVYLFSTSPKSASFSYYYKNYVRFAIRYEKDGQVYWNNNNGQDFILQSSNIAPNHPYYLGKNALLATNSRLNTVSSNGTNFAGNIVLKNLAYDKEVFVRYTTDHWQTYYDLPAYYVSNYNDGNEVWSYEKVFTNEVNAVEFAVCYKVNGITYWDNNFGRNYKVYQ